MPFGFEESLAEPRRFCSSRSLAEQRPDGLFAHECHRAESSLVQLHGNPVDRADRDPPIYSRPTSNQPPDLHAERIRQRVAERREQDPSLRMCPGKVTRAVQCESGLKL